MLLNSLIIENFKCFSDVKIHFNDLTLLTGLNSTGKSSAIQPLLLMAQNVNDEVISPKLEFNGDLVTLGSAGDILNVSMQSSDSSFTVEIKENATKFELTAAAKMRSYTIKNYSNDKKLANFLANLIYIGTSRHDHKEGYPTPRDNIVVGNVGNNGRYAPYHYNQRADFPVDKERTIKSIKSDSVRQQLNYWLNFLFTGAEADVIPQLDVPLFALKFRTSNAGEWRTPENVGYGFSYIFPILVALLTAKKGSIIIIDSPESHLHPKAQSNMGRMLGKFASSGLQIIIESHSDHILNGIRLSVQSDDIKNNKVGVLFFAGHSSSSHGINSLNIDKDAKIDRWPDGFFDQAEIDLRTLSGW